MICWSDQDLHIYRFFFSSGELVEQLGNVFFFSKNKITIWGIVYTQFIGDNLGIVFMKLGFGYIFGSCCLAWRRYRPNV
jgi:hypothetical protein